MTMVDWSNELVQQVGTPISLSTTSISHRWVMLDVVVVGNYSRRQCLAIHLGICCFLTVEENMPMLFNHNCLPFSKNDHLVNLKAVVSHDHDISVVNSLNGLVATFEQHVITFPNMWS